MNSMLKKGLFLFLLLACRSAFAQSAMDGMTAMQTENWDKAISVYEALVKANVTNQDAWLSLSSAYLGKGDKAKAMDALTKGFDAKNEGALAMICNARILLLKGDMNEADNQFKRAAKAGKKDIVALRQIGESYLYGDKKSLTRAEELLKTAYEYSTKDFSTLMALAYCYKEMGTQGGQAVLHYELANNVDPKNPLPVYMRAKVYKQARNPEKYVEFLNKTLELDPKNELALRDRAEHYYWSRKMNEAIDAYKALLKFNDYVTIEDEMQYANLLFFTKDYQGTIDQVEKIIKKDGSKNYLRRLLGYCYYENGDYKKGMEIMNDYFKVVAPEKILPSDYEYYGKLFEKNKQDSMAILNYKKAIEMDKTYWPLYQNMAALQFGMRKYGDAEQSHLARLDSIGKPSAMDYYSLGQAQFYNNSDSLHYVKAEQSFAKVCDLMPTKGTGWIWRARAMAKLEPDVEAHSELIPEYGKSKPYFEKYIEITEAGDQASKDKAKPDLIRSYAYLAYYSATKNETDKLRNYVDKLLMLDPNNETGKAYSDMLNGGAPVPAGKN